MLIDAHRHILSLAEDAVIGPAESVRDHPGFDKIVIMAVSPQFHDGELIGTVRELEIAFWQMAYTRGESDRA